MVRTCHAIAPAYEALSQRYKNVNFLKCDVDAAREVASRYAVSAMPTFVFLKGSTKVDQVRGADRSGLENALSKHASSSAATSSFSGKGQTLGGPTVPSPKVSTPAPRAAAVSPTAGLDPQLKVLLGLIGAYLAFWYVSS